MFSRSSGSRLNFSMANLSSSSLGGNFSLCHSPHHPIPVEINAKGVDAGDKNIEAEVELVAMDEKGVGEVALDNYWVFLLYLLLLLRVHFDLSRNLRHDVQIRPKQPSMLELPCLGNLLHMLQCRTCCLEV